MKVEIWGSEIEDCITALCDDGVYEPDKDFLIGEGAILIRTIEGADWNDCMRQHHELMGWEPYIPFEDVE